MGDVYRVKNWEKYQSFRKDRKAENSPWIKLHTKIYSDYHFMDLDVDHRYVLFGIFSFCDRESGILNISTKELEYNIGYKPIFLKDFHHFLELCESTTGIPSDIPVVTIGTHRGRGRGRGIKNTCKNVKDDLCTSSFQFPLKSGESWTISDELLSEYQNTFGSKIDVGDQLTRSRTWLISNPSKQKTKRGMPKYLNNWLTTANKDAVKVAKRIPNELPDEDLSRY